ncbi:hypothetical protein RDWZM_006286 [Blomia tropicalis]|uniref:Alkyl transferase n=1 Tax=Blomia tropicalis TaxID=40697 RepID=A0A9Q0M7V1_BLOTA|nr:hypothetical protein RDWZM_006286 [Blomia tropicalis]
MSLLRKTDRTLVERSVISILKCGTIPTHIAFIMDGNRRYAKKQKTNTIIGHRAGFDKLSETISWCRDLGVNQVTFYAFSIENFKRSADEVEGLLNLTREQLLKLIDEFEKIDKNQLCIRVHGKIDLMPLDIQQLIARVVLHTCRNSRFFLNICFAYTAREEISNAFLDLGKCVEAGLIETDDINEFALSESLYSTGLSDPDILLRTSGEIRLSDFLLWQTNFSYISFVDELWPDFSIWTLFGGILDYQVKHRSIRQKREDYKKRLHEEDMVLCEKRYQAYLNRDDQRSNSTITFEDFIDQRNQRLEKCYQFIRNKRNQFLKELVKDLSMNYFNTLKESCSLTDQFNNNSIGNGNGHAKTL